MFTVVSDCVRFYAAALRSRTALMSGSVATFESRAGIKVIIAEKGAFMGDKGGKKDKEKNKQQQLTKQKQEEQKKHDKAPAKKPAAGTA